MVEAGNNVAKPTPKDCPESEMSSLREEIRKSEEVRLDFLKYKLIAVATLAAVAFGFGAGDPNQANLPPRYVLAVIPFVCVYVDALCYHNNLRILVIAKFLRCHGDIYENFLEQWTVVLKAEGGVRSNVGFFFKMEDWVLDVSTRSLSLLVAVAGLCWASPIQRITIFVAGVLGIVISVIMRDRYEYRTTKIYDQKCDAIIATPPTGR